MQRSNYRMLVWAAGLYGVWFLATYALEGRVLTLQRPEAETARLAYAVVANLLIGLVGGALVLRWAVRRAGVPPQQLALRALGRTALSLTLGFGLGGAIFILQRPVTLDPVVLANAFSQVWVVSVAEVIVCWAVLGKAVQLANVGAQPGRVLLASAVSAVAFGLYHFAHSPPFNTPSMVALLTAVGFVTGAYFFITGELYGTIVFHNFLALKGVTEALAEGGRLHHFSEPQLPLIVMAMIATGVLVLADMLIRKERTAEYRRALS
jgi:hypothetical protein